MTRGCDGISRNLNHIRCGPLEVIEDCQASWEETIQAGVELSEEEGGRDKVPFKDLSLSLFDYRRVALHSLNPVKTPYI